MIETTKSEIDEKLRNYKHIRAVTIQSTLVDFEDNFDDISNEIENEINKYSRFYSSYDITRSNNNETRGIQFHILFYYP